MPGKQGAGEGRQIPGRAVQPEGRGEAALPDGSAIKGRNTPARPPSRFSASGKCTSHLGFGLEYTEMSIHPSHWPNVSAPLTRAGRSLCCRWSRRLKLRFAQDGLREAPLSVSSYLRPTSRMRNDKRELTMPRPDQTNPSAVGPWFVDTRCIRCDAARNWAPDLIGPRAVHF